MICIVCKRKLTDSIFSNDRKYKSCPKCSKLNGQQHVFFPYPSSFGTSEKRVTYNTPDGAQSYCYIHRGNSNKPIPNGGLLCGDLDI